MKKISVYLLIILGLIAVGYTSCKKEETDYRKEWVGQYICTWTNLNDATIITNGYIVDVSIYNDSCLYLKMSIGDFYPKITTDGYFIERNKLYKEVCEGNIFDDSIHINISTYVSPAYESRNYEYKGKKQ